MKQYLDRIFNATTMVGVCEALQCTLDSLRDNGYLVKLPDFYENIAAGNPKEVQRYFDQMKEDPQAQEEGNLREVYDLFGAALQQLRRFGFHRNY